MITLFCVLEGEPLDNAIPIDISDDKTIGYLRDLIKERRFILREVDAADLSLYRVSIPAEDQDALRDASREIAQGKNPKLGPWNVVGKVFPNPPAERCHVMVKYPFSDGILQPPAAHEIPYDVLHSLYDCWKGSYYGGSLKAFLANIYHYQSEWSTMNYDCRAVSIVQSSGTGKSRLVDEISKSFLGISFALRLDGETGYPPGDHEITRYLRSSDHARDIHVNFVGLLVGVIEHLSEWYEEYSESHPKASREEIAREWHDLMAPARANHADHKPTAPGQLPDTRSRFRQEFCGKILEKASSVQEKLAPNDRTPDLSKVDAIRKLLMDPTRALIQLMRGRNGMTTTPIAEDTDKGPLLFLAFDEAANLFKSDSDVRFAALRRVLRLLNEFPIWSVFLSTKSQIEYFDPPEKADPSARIRNQQLSRISPFIGLELDLEASRRLADPALCSQELKKPLCHFATSEHMSMFGRPLWLVYARRSYESIRCMARYKLLCGQDSYNVANKHHVFAAMASRLCLDPCMNNEEATALAKEAVNSHLRVVVGTDSSSGWMTTVTPSEPIVVDAVAEILMEEECWGLTVYTLTRDLLSKGLVEKGLKGELFSRLLMILARDVLLANTDMDPTQEFRYSQHFPLSKFLDTLYGDPDSSHIDNHLPIKEISSSPDFARALMNFSHFTRTDQILSRGTIQDLLHNLMRQQAALQLCPNEKHWDLLIPIYFGDPAAPFLPSALSAVVVQIKNRRRATPLEIEESHYEELFGTGDTSRNPVLCLYLDLESTSKDRERVKLSRNTGQPWVFGIYSRGAKASMFGCLEQIPGMEGAWKELFRVVGAQKALEEDICSHNLAFRYHGWRDRFPLMCEASGEQQAEAASGVELVPCDREELQTENAGADIEGMEEGDFAG